MKKLPLPSTLADVYHVYILYTCASFSILFNRIPDKNKKRLNPWCDKVSNVSVLILKEPLLQ
ncbi:hypothetical protein MKY41_01600 [Sporosarcina sp. FSL W7-1349]|uniref:hypothetical protein n=1 Tax=Sporosarcina sp. FSL W7-1349 TaxID=2921561 RepID=UPI0030F95EA5